jgi:hypothetical protein
MYWLILVFFLGGLSPFFYILKTLATETKGEKGEFYFIFVVKWT